MKSDLSIITGGYNIYKRTNNKYTNELMASLQDILYTVNIKSITGNAVDEVNDLQIDSRKVTTDSCFIAIKGSNTDGHNYINTAITNGAAVIICEDLPGDIKNGVMYLVVENSAAAAALFSTTRYITPFLMSPGRSSQIITAAPFVIAVLI